MCTPIERISVTSQKSFSQCMQYNPRCFCSRSFPCSKLRKPQATFQLVPQLKFTSHVCDYIFSRATASGFPQQRDRADGHGSFAFKKLQIRNMDLSLLTCKKLLSRVPSRRGCGTFCRRHRERTRVIPERLSRGSLSCACVLYGVCTRALCYYILSAVPDAERKRERERAGPPVTSGFIFRCDVRDYFWMLRCCISFPREKKEGLSVRERKKGESRICTRASTRVLRK